MEKPNRSQAEPSPPLIWPSAAKQVHDGGVPLVQHALKNSATVLGMASAVDSRGVTWIDSFLRDEPSLRVQVILAVFGGCPTRSDDLSRLLVIQDRAEGGQVQFRVLPMADGRGAPANCLLAVPAEGTPSAFLFGPTPNFGIDDADRTQINVWFEAERSLVDQWGSWFDLIWRQAAPLTEATADIPALVPVGGTPAAAAQWEAYCDLCAQSVKEPEGRLMPDPETGEMPPDQEGSESEDPSPTELAGLPRLDPLEDRVARLFRAGQQVTISRSSAVRPLEVPVSPRLLRQAAKIRHGMVAQHQSFSISAFTDEEIKEINEHRQATRTILEKLGLPLAKGVYWLPNEATGIFGREWKARNEEGQRKLGELVNGAADDFVTSKLDSIEEDLNGLYQRLGDKEEVPKDLLSRVVSDLKQRIAQALDGQLCARVAISGIQFVSPMELDCQAPWDQAEKLVLALARFPRKVTARWGRGRYPWALQTAAEEVLKAMDVANDGILRGGDDWRTAERARSELRVLDVISGAEISSRDRCEAGLMLIDGRTTEDIVRFIREAVSRTK